MPKMSKAEQDRLLDQQITDRKYLSPAQLKLIEDLLGGHQLYDWRDFKEVCQEAFCDSAREGLELEADQKEWKDLTSIQASAVIDYLKMG
jgi:hypothetical protein